MIPRCSSTSSVAFSLYSLTSYPPCVGCLFGWVLWAEICLLAQQGNLSAPGHCALLRHGAPPLLHWPKLVVVKFCSSSSPQSSLRHAMVLCFHPFYLQETQMNCQSLSYPWLYLMTMFMLMCSLVTLCYAWFGRTQPLE